MIALNVLTSIGHVAVERRYLACPACKGKRIPWDEWAGVDHRRMSQEARRMLSLAGMSWPFDTAAKRLKELCHVNVSDDTIERVCQEEGDRARRWPAESEAPAQAFTAAKRFGPDTQWMVDVFHVSEHLHACGKAMLGEGSPARQWAESQLERLIEIQGPRFVEELELQIARAKEPASREALEKLRSYLNENRDSLWYATRLAEGLPIGSGLIEGACKNTIGARLKINSARWRVRRAERIGSLRCLEYSRQWEAFWQNRAA